MATKPILADEKGPCILIIDDEEAMLDSGKQVLMREGYDVETAQDGATGIKAVQNHKPDLVLVDLKMPGISGQEVLERITRIDDSIATVVITAYATVSTAIESIRYGASDFLAKPFTPDELRAVVARSLERRRAYLEARAASKEKTEAIRYFISMIRHEVVTPLREVRKKLSHVESSLPRPMSSDVRDQLAYCTTTIERISHLVEKWQNILQPERADEKSED